MKKKSDEFGSKKLVFKNTNEALKALIKKEQQKEFRKKAKEIYNLQHISRQQSQVRSRAIGFMGSRAEQLEIQMVNLNEVPLLHRMESERIRLTSPPDKYIEETERSITRSFPG